MVTVSSRTPRIIPTPRTMPAAVRSERSRRARTCRIASEPKLRIGPRSLEARECLDQPLGGAAGHLAGDPAVTEEDDPAGDRRRGRIVGHDHERLPVDRVELAQQLEHLPTRA